MTTEEFTNEVVEAIRDKTTSELRRKFRNVNLLLLDDIQFLVGKEKVQEELFHTFNSLIDKGGQIVFSSDRPPQEIKKLEARLASRFEGGLSVDIQPPDFELRCAILMIKAQKYGIDLSYDDAKIISEKVDDSRALEGFILKLSSARDGGEEINPGLINKLLGRNKQERSLIIRPDNIVTAICDFYNIKTTQLKGVKRDSFLVGPRHVCMYLLKEETGLTFVEIGNLLGGRDHTTVMHAVEKIGKSVVESERIREEISFIKTRIKEGLS
jgi:chromosomal replication initiator protein